MIGNSAMLANMVDKARNNAPTAGIRIVVPEYLRATEKQLSDYGRRLRGKHGKGTKTHIKYDDGDRSIYLNVKLRGDDTWSRVYPEFARDWLQKLRHKDAEELNKHLNCDVGRIGDLQDENATRKTTAREWRGSANDMS